MARRQIGVLVRPSRVAIMRVGGAPALPTARQGRGASRPSASRRARCPGIGGVPSVYASIRGGGDGSGLHLFRFGGATRACDFQVFFYPRPDVLLLDFFAAAVGTCPPDVLLLSPAPERTVVDPDSPSPDPVIWHVVWTTDPCPRWPAPFYFVILAFISALPK